MNDTNFEELIFRTNGLSNVDMVIFFYIKSRGHVKANHIASDLKLDPMNISHSLNNLKERGLIDSENGMISILK